MSGSRILFLALAIVAAVTVVFAVSGDEGSADLAKKIESLEKRIASLEQTIVKRLTSIEQKVASGGGPSPQLESEAQAAYSQVNSLVAAGKYEDAKKKMQEFMRKYAATNTAKQARRLNTELAVIGKAAPAKWDIQKWFQGEKEVDLSSDKTTLLVFWEVWCPHCKREVPKLQKLYTDLKGDGLQVVGLTKVNRSATDESVQSFVTERGVGYPVAKESGSLSSHFSVSGVPAAAVVKGGKVVWRGHPARLSEKMLRDWL